MTQQPIFLISCKVVSPPWICGDQHTSILAYFFKLILSYQILPYLTWILSHFSNSAFVRRQARSWPVWDVMCWVDVEVCTAYEHTYAIYFELIVPDLTIFYVRCTIFFLGRSIGFPEIILSYIIFLAHSTAASRTIHYQRLCSNASK